MSWIQIILESSRGNWMTFTEMLVRLGPGEREVKKQRESQGNLSL
jgi:hypothetical protein